MVKELPLQLATLDVFAVESIQNDEKVPCAQDVAFVTASAGVEEIPCFLGIAELVECPLKIAQCLGMWLPGDHASVEMIDRCKLILVLKSDDCHLMDGNTRGGNQNTGQIVVSYCVRPVRQAVSGRNLCFTISGEVAELNERVMARAQNQGSDLWCHHLTLLSRFHHTFVNLVGDFGEFADAIGGIEVQDVLAIESLSGFEEAKVVST